LGEWVTRYPGAVGLRCKSTGEAGTTDARVDRNANLERVLTAVVENGLRSGRLALGHQDGVGEVIPLLQASKLKRNATSREGGLGGEGRIPVAEHSGELVRP